MALQKLNNNTSPMVWDNGNGGHELSVITRANTIRAGTVAYRTAITALDKTDAFVAPTVADVATGGSLAFNTNYKFSYAGGDSYFVGIQSSIANTTTANDAANTHVIQATIPQTTGAEYYDLFMSTDAAPKWVARITEAQRAAGVTITAVGTVDPTSPAAGKVDVRAVGTGVASNSAPFVAAGTGTSAGVYDFDLADDIDCSGYTSMDVFMQMTCTDLRNGAGTLLFPVFAYDSAADDYVHLQSISLSWDGYTKKLATVSVNGLDRVKIFFGSCSVALPGMSVNLYYDLY